MITKVVNKVKDPVIFGTLIVTVGVFIASIFSYALQFLLGRSLTVGEYGTFNALLALYNVVAVPGTVLSTSLIKISSELKVKELYDKLTYLFWSMSGLMFIFGISLLLVILVFRNFIAGYLNISDTSAIVFFGVAIAFGFLNIVPFSYLQGLLRFRAFAFANVVNGFLRLVVPMSLVYAGYRVAGVFGGIATGSILAYLITTLVLRRNFTSYTKESLSPFYKQILAFSLPVLFVNLGMMLLNNLDIILVKRFFDEVSAGYYSGAVTVAKVLLFGAGTVAVVMFPQISTLKAKGEDFRGKFGMFFGLQLLIVLIGIAIFALIPGFITQVMFGVRFLPSVPYVPLFAVFSGLYVLVNFMILFFLAIGETKIFLLQIPAVIFQFFLIRIYHANLFQVIHVNLAVTSVLLISIFLYYYLNVSLRYRSRI